MSKILLYDIEVTANVGDVWGKWQTDVIKFRRHWYMLCFAYKWLGEKETHVVSLTDFPEYSKNPENDFYVIAKLWQLMNEADIVIGHNSKSFDDKMTNARFMVHNFEPPSPYKNIDTKLVAKRYARFTSNKLDDLGEQLGLGHKLSTGGYGLWLACEEGDPKAWNKMKRYNKQDVVLLEKVYLKLRPWIENHPNVGLMESGNPDFCENCGGKSLHHRGTRYTNRRRYQRLRCNTCGHWQKGGLIKLDFQP